MYAMKKPIKKNVLQLYKASSLCELYAGIYLPFKSVRLNMSNSCFPFS